MDMKTGIQYNINITKNEIKAADLDILGAEYGELFFAGGAKVVRINYTMLEQAVLDGALDDLSISGTEILVTETIGLKTKDEIEKLTSLLIKCLPGFKSAGLSVCIENGYVTDGTKIYEGPLGSGVSLSAYIDRLNEKAGEEFFKAAFNIGCARALRLQIIEHVKALGNKISVLYVSDNDGKADLRQMPYTFTSVHSINSAGWEDLMDHFSTYAQEIFIIGDVRGTFAVSPKELKGTFLSLIGEILGEWKSSNDYEQIELPVNA